MWSTAKVGRSAAPSCSDGCLRHYVTQLAAGSVLESTVISHQSDFLSRPAGQASFSTGATDSCNRGTARTGLVRVDPTAPPFRARGDCQPGSLTNSISFDTKLLSVEPYDVRLRWAAVTLAAVDRKGYAQLQMATTMLQLQPSHEHERRRGGRERE